jgi:hypothetical protein
MTEPIPAYYDGLRFVYKNWKYDTTKWCNCNKWELENLKKDCHQQGIYASVAGRYKLDGRISRHLYCFNQQEYCQAHTCINTFFVSTNLDWHSAQWGNWILLYP